MKRKRVLIPLMLILYSLVFSQVGINTASPESSLDIRSVNHLGSVTDKDGILVPRVSDLSVNGSVNGQLVYLIANSGTFSQGFHYWNGNAWISLGVSTGAIDTTVDAWINDKNNAMVHLGTRSDGSTGRAAGTEFVSKDNGAVGIGSAAPKVTLQVDGQVSNTAIADGLSAPRLTRAQLSAKDAVYGPEQNGTLVFVSALDGSAIGKVSNITTVGLYYYDAPSSKWFNVKTTASGVVENFKIITGTYTTASPYVIQPDDYMLFLRFNSASTDRGGLGDISTASPFLNSVYNLVLPDPSTCPGRILHLVNDGYQSGYGTQEVLTNYPMYSYDGAYQYTARPNLLSYILLSNDQNGGKWRIMSDGVRWISVYVVVV